MKICLNMIVKNEVANLMRCFNSVLPHISSWVIVDTGSDDGTPDLIRGYFGSRDVPGYLHHIPFKDFSQARNAALQQARDSSLVYDFLLLTDADMELVVEDDSWRNELTGAAHDVLQRQGDLAYWNIRLVRGDCDSLYHGVTHEYFGAPSAAHVRGIWFRDHASGGSRGDKVERDIRLLSADIEKNPGNDRSWFYLAQSYKDLGKFSDAINAYAKRISLGGWDEEVWYAKRSLAKCHQSLGNEAEFVRHALLAYNDRPWRAETLLDLAKYFRENGKNAAAVLFAQKGLSTRYPENDLLFVEDHVYKHAFREEIAIAGFYLPDYKLLGFMLADQLALGIDVPQWTRDLARQNLFHYLPRLSEIARSFSAKRIDLEFPKPYTPMNPSIVERAGELFVNVRTVNYIINEAGQYVYPDGDPVIRTRNWLCWVADDLSASAPVEITSTLPVAWDQVIGYEDVRLWHTDCSMLTGELYASATVRQISPNGACQMVKARVDFSLGGEYHFVDWEAMSPSNQTQKNWMPVIGKPGTFIYSMDHVWNGTVIHEKLPHQFAADHFRGGGQAIPFDDGYLCIIHEAMNHQHYAQRMYAHRFVWLDAEFRLQKVSLPFVFFDKQIEFAAGLAIHPRTGDVLVSFGVRDREAWISSVAAGDVRGILR